LGCGLNLWLFTPKTNGIIISRKEDSVDKKGDPSSLFWKLDFMLEHLPEWCRPEFRRSDMHLENLWNDNSIDGEATVENVGRSGRSTWAGVDEMQAIKHENAAAIDRSLSDTAGCRIYIGTSEYRSHPFSAIGRKKGVNAKFLGWWLHPWKNKGLYWSPDLNQIIIEDIAYYMAIAPEVFKKYQKGEVIKYSTLEEELLFTYPEKRVAFIADGGRVDKPKWRSPWYDNEELTRDPMDTATNLDGNEIGAGDSVFSPMTIQRMRDEHCKKPVITGKVLFDLRENKLTNARFIEGRGKVSWWGELGGARPPQNHNYVMGCDISLGQGKSNSVCSVFDVDTRTKVGCLCDPYILPEQFAEAVVAMGRWIGGASKVPYLNFEANGIGQVFARRIRELGYTFLYRDTTERKGFHQKLNTVGWTSNQNAKLELLMNYNAAMTACFRSGQSNAVFINPDLDAVNEAEDYIFSGKEVVPASCVEDSGGAKAAHGDRVIADALCCLAAIEQPRAAKNFSASIVGTQEWVIEEMENDERKQKQAMKKWLNY
jgi:hypothetical protein